MASRIRWSGVKKVRRALEKVLRSYREVVPPAQLAQNCTPAAQTLASSAFSVMAMPFLFPMPFLCRPAEASNRRPRGPGPQDVSRLVDLCREGIVFDRLSDLAACLDAVVRRWWGPPARAANPAVNSTARRPGPRAREPGPGDAIAYPRASRPGSCASRTAWTPPTGPAPRRGTATWRSTCGWRARRRGGWASTCTCASCSCSCGRLPSSRCAMGARRAPWLRRRACAGRGCARSAPTSLRRGVGRTQNPAERIGAPADRGDVWTDACTCSESGRNEDSHLARGGRAERIGARCGMTRRHAWTGTDKCGLMRGAPGLGRASRGTGDTWTSGTCAGSDGGARARLRPGCAGGRV